MCWDLLEQYKSAENLAKKKKNQMNKRIQKLEVGATYVFGHHKVDKTPARVGAREVGVWVRESLRGRKAEVGMSWSSQKACTGG